MNILKEWGFHNLCNRKYITVKVTPNFHKIGVVTVSVWPWRPIQGVPCPCPIQFSFIYIAPNYNNCHLKALR